jgi:hypothetical protein
MNMKTRVILTFGLALTLAAGVPASALRAADAPAAPHDGTHDFDFHLGTWKTHISRLVHPLTGSTAWTDYDGISRVLPVWNGRASLFELEAGGPAGHLEGAGLRLYDAQSRQWNLNWANSTIAKLDGAMMGEFRGGRGDFFGEDTFNGRTILVRNSFLDITANASRFEQAFSDDYGRTWETNWIMTFERMAPPPTPKAD